MKNVQDIQRSSRRIGRPPTAYSRNWSTSSNLEDEKCTRMYISKPTGCRWFPAPRDWSASSNLEDEKCTGRTFFISAAKMKIPLEAIEIECKGSLDPDGFKGVNPNAKIGLSNIETVYNFKSSASKDELNKLIEFVEKHCPVMDTIVNTPEHSSTINSCCCCG